MSPSETPASDADDALGTAEPKSNDAALRNQDIEEATNRLIIHRVSMALIPLFIKTRVTPNSVSCMGALSGLAASWFYFHYENPIACLFGLFFMFGWHVFDGADGQLARLTGQTSPLGFVIDGVCDYATYIFVYVALALALTETYGTDVWFVVVTAGVFHAIQAAAFEMQREFYIRWTGDDVYTHLSEQTEDACPPGTANFIATLYKSVQEYFRPLSCTIEENLRTSITDDARKNLSQDSYRACFRKHVVAWSILSANNRTVAIFLFCIIGQPLAYFIFEITLLTLLLLVLVKLNRNAQVAFAQKLGLQG